MQEKNCSPYPRAKARGLAARSLVNGNTLVWITEKADLINNIHKGQKVCLTGRVREHSEYRGTKQTVMTRCKGVVA